MAFGILGDLKIQNLNERNIKRKRELIMFDESSCNVLYSLKYSKYINLFKGLLQSYFYNNLFIDKH